MNHESWIFNNLQNSLNGHKYYKNNTVLTNRSLETFNNIKILRTESHTKKRGTS